MKSSMIVICIFMIFSSFLYPALANNIQQLPEFIQQLRQHLIMLRDGASTNTYLLMKISMDFAKIGDWEQAILIAKNTRFPKNVAYTMSHLALVSGGFGDKEHTEQFANEVLQIVDENYGDDGIIMLGNIAKASANIGQIDSVIRIMEQTTHMIETHSSTMYAIWMIPNVWDDLSDFFISHGKKELMISHLERLTLIAKEIGSDKGEIALANIARSFAKIGEIEKAKRIIDTFGYSKDRTLLSIATICITIGKYEEGVQLFNTALQLNQEYFKTRNDLDTSVIDSWQAIFFISMADAFSQVGKVEQATQFLQNAHQLAEPIHTTEIDVFLKLSESFRKVDQSEHVIRMIDLAIQNTETIHESAWKAYLFSDIAERCMDIGLPEKGEHLIEKALYLTNDMPIERDDESGKVRILASAATTYIRRGQLGKTLEILKQMQNAADCFDIEGEGLICYKANILSSIVHSYPDIGHLQQAYHIMQESLSDPYAQIKVVEAILSVWVAREYPEFKEIKPVTGIGERDLM